MAQRQVRWHYQWIIVHEFLPLTNGQELVDNLLRKGPRFYRIDDDSDVRRDRRSKDPLIPIEFSVAAYRFGHSQIRPSYRLNFGPTGGSPVFAFLFDDTQDPNDSDPNDMRGGKRAPRRFVDWQTFFKFDNNFRPNKKIDGKLSSVVMLLPGSRGPAPGLPAIECSRWPRAISCATSIPGYPPARRLRGEWAFRIDSRVAGYAQTL